MLLLQEQMKPDHQLDCASPALSLFAFSELTKSLAKLKKVQLILPAGRESLALLGEEADRAARNRLITRSLAQRCYQWLNAKVELKRASAAIPQGIGLLRNAAGAPHQVVTGSFALTTDGLGLTPGNPMSLIQASESPQEAAMFAPWFDNQWQILPSRPNDKTELLDTLRDIAEQRSPATLYNLIPHQLFKEKDDGPDEERVVKSATGIRNTVVWNKLFKFQRDGVVGAIDKLNRFGGCINADSVGLGKTFEALAVIKYHELRNDRVLVLCPKRLRDNWTIYKANDRRNLLASDRFNYDVLNHTDLSRDAGLSGDLDLSHINWGCSYPASHSMNATPCRLYLDPYLPMFLVLNSLSLRTHNTNHITNVVLIP